jgi:L-asparaginase / beta-aspartyl-peptidase
VNDERRKICRALQILLATFLVVGASTGQVQPESHSQARPHRPQWKLVIHAGARAYLPEADGPKTRDALRRALDAGGNILASGGHSVEALQSAVHVLEDSGVFDAGRGTILNHDGFAELDASIMNGRDRKAGAVAAVRHVANPIDLARLVMDRTKHVLLVGEGAEQFAMEQNITLVPPSYFVNERNQQDLQKALNAERGPARQSALPWHPTGTTGAIALDQYGDLAAATSSGGLTNKHFGRVGDSPIIGAGTYAENGVCAVSATGVGEYFIRYTAAADICARIKYGKESIQTAAQAVIDELSRAGASGGVTAMDANGNVAMPYSSATMPRGWVSSEHSAEVIVETEPKKGATHQVR